MGIVEFVLLSAGLLFTGVLASKLSSRLGIPALLLFLAIGMIAGSEGLIGIELDDPEPVMLLGVVALSLIIFGGGLQTDVKSMSREVRRDGILLASVGVILTAGLVGAFAVYVFGVDWTTGLLLGSIVSSTDAAAVFSVLRAKRVGVKARIRSLLEFESGSNDPTAVFLTMTLVAVSTGEQSVGWLLPVLFVYKLAGGIVAGMVFGRVLVYLLNHIDLEYDGLYPVVTLAGVGLVFGLTEAVGASGFMAAYVTGLVMAKSVFVHRNSLIRFHEGLAWLMQIAMFMVLGLLVFPSNLVQVAPAGIMVALFLVFGARPVAVFASLLFSHLSLRERTLVAWVGLRGAAPIILATFPLVAGVGEADYVFDVVFFAVIVSVLLQGPSVAFVARRLGVDAPLDDSVAHPIEISSAQDLGVKIKRLVVGSDSIAVGARLLEIGGPTRPLIVMLRRGGRIFVPTGSTVIDEYDELFALGDPESMQEMREVLSRPRS
jgi:cell volume regulation protein A